MQMIPDLTWYGSSTLELGLVLSVFLALEICNFIFIPLCGTFMLCT